MTTIVYRDGIICADTMISDSIGGIHGRVNKIGFSERYAGGCAGDMDNMVLFKKWVENDCKDVPEFSEEMEGFVIDEKLNIYFVNNKGLLCPVDVEFTACGSGSHFAIGAMAHGATAEEALAIAAKHDSHTNNIFDVVKHGQWWSK